MSQNVIPSEPKVSNKRFKLSHKKPVIPKILSPIRHLPQMAGAPTPDLVVLDDGDGIGDSQVGEGVVGQVSDAWTAVQDDEWCGVMGVEVSGNFVPCFEGFLC